MKKKKHFITIDLRKNKENGILSKSQLLNMGNFDDETINDLIEDFIEFKSNYHFCFIISDFSIIQNLGNLHNNDKVDWFLTQPEHDDSGFLKITLLTYFLE